MVYEDGWNFMKRASVSVTRQYNKTKEMYVPIYVASDIQNEV